MLWKRQYSSVVSIPFQYGAKGEHDNPENPGLVGQLTLCSKLCAKAQATTLGPFPGPISTPRILCSIKYSYASWFLYQLRSFMGTHAVQVSEEFCYSS